MLISVSVSDFNSNPGLKEKFLWNGDVPVHSQSLSENNVELKSLLQLTMCPLREQRAVGGNHIIGFLTLSFICETFMCYTQSFKVMRAVTVCLPFASPSRSKSCGFNSPFFHTQFLLYCC